MPLLIAQILFSILAAGLMVLFHAPWFPALFERLSGETLWFLQASHLSPLGWKGLLSLGLVLLCNLVFWKDLLVQFAQKHWDLTAVIRGFSIAFSGIFVIIGFLTYNTQSQAFERLKSYQLEQVQKIKPGMALKDVKSLLAGIVHTSNIDRVINFPQTQRQLSLDFSDDKVRSFVFKGYQPQCLILWESPLKTNQNYPLVCSETLQE